MPRVSHSGPSLGRGATPAALAALVVCGLAVRLWVLRLNAQLDSDEVLPGLMALHIAAGKEAPVFFYGQHYFGALEAYFVAGLFKLAGFRPWLLVVPPMAASLALIPLTYGLAMHVGGRAAGLLACLPLAFPPPILAKLFTNAGGGFSLAFALHAAALLWVLRAVEARGAARRALRRAMAFAFIMGFLCWVWQPALALLPPLLAYLLVRLSVLRRPLPLLATCAAALPGLAAPLLYNATQGWPTLLQLGAKYTSPANEATSGEWAGPRAVATFLVTAFGGGNEADGGANPLQAALVAGSFAAVALLLPRCVHQARRAAPGEVCRWRGRAEAAGVLAGAAVLDVVSAHNTVRHLVPAALLGYVFLGAALALAPTAVPRAARTAVAAAVAAAALVAIVLPNLLLDARGGTIFRHFTASTVEVRTAVDALRDRGLATGYSDYWSAYPITYFSGENVVVSPALPAVWGGRFDRYPPYTRRVDEVDDPARLFVLLDAQCDLLPYVLPLEQHDATYRLEHVGRWYLVWDVQAAPDVPSVPAAAAPALLADWRRAIATGPPC